MNFVWDEAKRDRVFASRGIDFSDFVPEFFDGRALLSVPTPRHGEDRYLSIGVLHGKAFAVVWMPRDGLIRIITARRARREEERQYGAVFTGRAIHG